MVEEKSESHPEKKFGSFISEKSIREFTSRMRKNPWMVATIVLAIFCIILLYFVVGGGKVSGDSAGTKIISYLNGLTGGGVSFVSVKDIGSLYEITVSYQNQQIPVYSTKDGKYFINGATKIDVASDSNSNTNTQQANIPKTDKPKVELFVMTYCPYGTQSEKGIIPVLKLLGDKIDASIRFVHYFMHGDQEEKETYNQLCIREQQNSKYLDYLSCFLEDSNSSRCLTKTGINMGLLNTCLANNYSKAKEYYAADSALSKDYGVQGSPTLIVNGVEADIGRNADRAPNVLLGKVCSGFNTAASECSGSVSSDIPSPGFGYSASSSNPSASASCG